MGTDCPLCFRPALTGVRNNRQYLYCPDCHWESKTDTYFDNGDLRYVCDACGETYTPLEQTSAQYQYPTGAVRSTDCQGLKYSLISPVGLRRLAATCHEGSIKYGDYNWERGMPVRDLLDHAIRHLYQYLDGDRTEDHLAHAAWNLFAAMHSEERWPDLNQNLRPAS